MLLRISFVRKAYQERIWSTTTLSESENLGGKVLDLASIKSVAAEFGFGM